MKFIMINGCSCAGKSTIVKRIINEKERYYQLSSDSQKWLFSKYDRTVHFEDVRKVVRSLAETLCAMEYTIVCDSALYRENRETLLEIPKKYGYDIVEINLEAAYPVLEKRFEARLEEASKNPHSKISNTSKERFKELYDIYQSEKNKEALTFQTDDMTLDETFSEIDKVL